MDRRKTFAATSVALIRLAACTALIAVAAPAVHAATWPGGSCNSTLQDCINAAPPGDTVTISYNGSTPYVTAIDEDIVIGNSLTLTASDQIDAVFTSGHFITIQSPLSGTINVTLQRLTLLHGHVLVKHNSDVAGSYALNNVTMKETDATAGSCAIEFTQQGTGLSHFTLGDSRIESRITGASANGFCALGTGGPWALDFFRNHVRAENGSILRAISINGTSSGNVSVEGNQVSGSGFASGIDVSQNPGSASNALTVQDNSVVGQRTPATAESAIHIQTTNGDVHVVNNTVVNNSRGLVVQRFAADTSVGRVANNLVAFNADRGIDIGSFVSNDYNLVYANGSNSYVPGAHTVVVDPQLRSLRDPRPQRLSPAQDAGNGADVSTFFGIAFDADGERRFSDAGVDIGAYEYNDDYAVVQTSDAGNTGLNVTSIDALSGRLTANEFLLVTPHDAPIDAAEGEANLGVFEDSGLPSLWAIFREDLGTLSTQRRFSVLAPYDGRTRYVHTSAVADVVNAFTRLDNAELNGSSTAIAFIQHNWNPGGGGGTYHDHPVALSYSAPRWYIGNQDSVDMPAGVSFNVVIAPLGSPNASTVPVPASGYCCVTLYHPLLDNNACAAPIVTRNNRATALSDGSAYRVHYARGPGGGASGHWDVRTVSGTFVPGTAFNVMVQGAQANSCRDDVIFADGADG